MSTRNTWLSGMSPVAADCASADNAPGELAPLAVVDGDADVVVAVEAPREAPPVEAPPVEVGDELLDEDPQPAMTIEDASTAPNTESLFMARRLAIRPDDLLNGWLLGVQTARQTP